MSSLRIPQKYQTGLAKFLRLSEESAQTLFLAFEKAPLTPDLREVLGETISKTGTILPNEVNSLADALMSLFIIRSNSSDESTPEFVEKVVQAVERSGIKDLEITSEFLESARSRLTRLFGIESLALNAKTFSVMTDHGTLFYKARIVTDIRPVFGETVEAPRAAVIVHNLRIHYLQDTDHKDFYVALDTQDIDKFIDVLQRAKAKANGLKSILAIANLPYIEPE